MASSLTSAFHLLTCLPHSWSTNLECNFTHPLFAARRRRARKSRALVISASSNDELASEKSTKLVTFLGKGGSGKTTAAVFAAQVASSKSVWETEGSSPCTGHVAYRISCDADGNACYGLLFYVSHKYHVIPWLIGYNVRLEHFKLDREHVSVDPDSRLVPPPQHYAKAGLSTCLVTHSQDLTAEYLLNCKIGTHPAMCSNNLSAVRLETTKMLLDPLKRLKEADSRVNLTQGVLEGIVGEELGVLPGMDSIFSVFALERYVGFLGIKAQKNHSKDKFDIVIYDGLSTEDTLRMMSSASNARLYVKYIRNVAEKTDLGRLAGPSLLRLVDEAMSLSGSSSGFNGKLSSEIWDSLERILERGASAFADPQKFGCYIIADPCNPISVKTALRYWGCAIQAGASVSGAFGMPSQNSSMELVENVKKSFFPLPFALILNISEYFSLDWDMIISNPLSKDARNLLRLPMEKASNITSSVKFDLAKRCITLFMPGFDKSEIKLYQYRGGSELLVETGDQRRVIVLPREIQGKVGGAKFTDRSLVITMRL